MPSPSAARPFGRRYAAASATPVFRQISSTGVPASPCLSATAICSSVYRLFLIDPSSRLLPEPQNEPKSTTLYESRSWLRTGDRTPLYPTH